jgi:hypothetical protein
MSRHLKKPQGLHTSKIAITITANGLALVSPIFGSDVVHRSGNEKGMSALGQKQTLGKVRLMSALPPKADVTERDRPVKGVLSVLP